MKKTYSIKDLIRLLMSHIWLIVIVTILGGAAAFAFSKYVLPLKYSSHITMYVQSYTGITENNNNANNISNSKQLVNTYMEVLKDDAVMNAVGDKLLEQYDKEDLEKYLSVNSEGKVTPSSIRKCLTITSVVDTSAVKVVATTLDPELAADICNDLTEVAPEYVEKAVGVGSINTIDKAKVYKTPVAPNKMKNTAIGMAAAFMLIVLIIFIIDFFDNTIKEPDEAAELYNKAIIGEIQQFGDGKKKSSKKNKEPAAGRGLLTDKDVPFNVVESYKSIRTNLLFTIATSEKKVIAVSSPNPCEGKSTSAANIAIALAQTGSSVLLIDGDMRKPIQHQTFKVKNSEGLSTLIINQSTEAKSVRKNVTDHLDLLPSGPIPPNPSELLASDNFRKLLTKFAEEYDYIIIDTPPINMVSDAMVLNDNISGIVLVLRYAATTFDDLSDCMKQADIAQANVLGFIMNDVHRKGKHSYYDYKKYVYSSTPENKKENKKEEKKNAD